MKHGDDVRRKRDQSVVQILQYKTEDEPEGKVVPADQSVQVMAIACVIPRAAAERALQRPSGGVLHSPNAHNIDQASRRPWQRSRRIMKRLEQEDDQTVQREAPQIGLSLQSPIPRPSQTIIFHRRPEHFRAPTQKTIQ